MRLHHIHRTTFGGRIIGDLLIEEVRPTDAMKLAAEKYPNERHQYISSMALDTPRVRRPRPRQTAA